MPRKSVQSSDSKQYYVFNPEDVKQSVEIVEKPKLAIDDIMKIEKPTKKNLSLNKKIRKSKSLENINKGKYTLIITEKPQAATKIAAALSQGNDRRVTDGGVSYYELDKENKKIIVACAVGHLFTVSQKIKGSYYPIFDIGWYPNFEVNKKDFTKKYFNLLKKLVKEADEITIATDFDVEGEVIGFNIVRFIAKRQDAKRMKFSSLTYREIQDSYDKRLPSIEWGQAIAGETRHFIDWIYGINLSRALMHAIKSTGKFRKMSIGRVQGPTLKLIVDKENKIKNFKPQPYWQVFIIISDGKNNIELKYIKDITKKEELEKFKGFEGKKVIASTIKTKELLQPLAPFDLTTLQTEAYKFFSITPSQTLNTAQKLYLNGLISYPRTSSQKIPDVQGALSVLKRLEKHYLEFVNKVTRQKPVEGSKSDPAHPAIIPTGNFQILEENDKKIYELIVKRFISCFCDIAELENKKVEVNVNGLRFLTKGMEIIKKGWLEVYPMKMDEKEIKDFNGEVLIEKLRIEQKETKPPKRFSPASIIAELEKRNLGTKATRANIIETLYKRNYIEDRQIKATELGIRLIESLEKHSPIIIDENLTRDMEKEMELIRSSKKDLEKKEENVLKKTRQIITKISDDFKKQEKEIGKELLEANNLIFERVKENNNLGIKCPNCNEGELVIKFAPKYRSYFIGCNKYPDCSQTYPLPRSLIKNEANKKCELCAWPMLVSIKKGKRAWIFCFNPECPGRKNVENNKT